MKIFSDTNVLISAALFPNSIPYKAFQKAVSEPNIGVICDLNVDELKKIFARKFPNKIQILNTFLSIIMTSVMIVRVPDGPISGEEKIRDEKDRPIFRAAISAGVDIFLTGDKDFLESGIEDPRIVSPSEFVAYKKEQEK